MDCCAFCLEEPQTPVILVNCKHSFCSQCIRAFLKTIDKKQKLTCPLCRQEVNEIDIWRWRTSGLTAGLEISHFRNDINKTEYFANENKFKGDEVHFSSLYSKEDPYSPHINVKPRSSSWWNGLH
mmetsp:Transcript_25054/g.42853  ORF Transcript_25054/g.42853 Transcript_25054/m.42853 type:complete len:125 (+) Transcript_25054:41-415(+)